MNSNHFISVENEIQALRIREADWVEHLNIFDELELKAGLVSIVRQWIIEYNAQVFHTKKIPQNKFIGEGGKNKPTSLIRSLCRPEIVEPEIKPKCLHPLFHQNGNVFTTSNDLELVKWPYLTPKLSLIYPNV